MIGASTVFFEPDWPRRARSARLGRRTAGARAVRRRRAASRRAGWSLAAGGRGWSCSWPCRCGTSPTRATTGGRARATGSRWNVLLTEKAGAVTFLVHEPATGRRWVADPTELYTPHPAPGDGDRARPDPPGRPRHRRRRAGRRPRRRGARRRLGVASTAAPPRASSTRRSTSPTSPATPGPTTGSSRAGRQTRRTMRRRVRSRRAAVTHDGSGSIGARERCGACGGRARVRRRLASALAEAATAGGRRRLGLADAGGDAEAAEGAAGDDDAGGGGGEVGVDLVDTREVAGAVLGERAGPAGDAGLADGAAQRHRVGEVGDDRVDAARRRRGRARRRRRRGRPTPAATPCRRRARCGHFADVHEQAVIVRPSTRGTRKPLPSSSRSIGVAVDGERDERHRRVGDRGEERRRRRRRAGATSAAAGAGGAGEHDAVGDEAAAVGERRTCQPVPAALEAGGRVGSTSTPRRRRSATSASTSAPMPPRGAKNTGALGSATRRPAAPGRPRSARRRPLRAAASSCGTVAARLSWSVSPALMPPTSGSTRRSATSSPRRSPHQRADGDVAGGRVERRR